VVDSTVFHSDDSIIKLEESVHAKLLHPAGGCPVSELSIWVSQSTITCIEHKILKFYALKFNQTMQILQDSHSSITEDYSLLGCAVLVSKQLLMHANPSPLGSSSRLFDPTCEGSTFL
jgi:hypothetical protein